ncbi:hypothetical protein MBLNU459_g7474t1 [Dothideomycetes sp. NU459]
MDEQQAVAAAQKAPRSPPMAFEMTSNDALWARSQAVAPAAALTSPPLSKFLDFSASECEMQAQLDKQADALRLQHQAFVAERDGWQLERDRLYRRITALETLLKSASGHSPERSPVVSPHSGNVKPALALARLASIAEIDASTSLVENHRNPPILKRESAPARIDLSALTKMAPLDGPASVALESTNAEVAPELPQSPPVLRTTLSPPPRVNRHLAGHTPLKVPHPGEISPALSSLSERLADTPTRSNTHANELLTEDLDEDRPLKGPLHMPELPHSPGEENFTMAMLDARLKDLVEHPDENQPLVLQSPSPGLVAPEATTAENDGDCTTATLPPPNTMAAESTPAIVADHVETVDTIKLEVDNGGIKLRKKPSCNFGAPLGQLGPWKH